MNIERLDSTTYAAALPLLALQLEEHGIEISMEHLDNAVRGLLAVEGRGAVLLARVDGAPVGVASLSSTWTLEYGGSVMWLEELYVLPACRNLGFGSALLAAALELARAAGHLAMDLEVDTEHARVIDLYLRNGFRRLSRERLALRLGARTGLDGS